MPDIAPISNFCILPSKFGIKVARGRSKMPRLRATRDAMLVTNSFSRDCRDDQKTQELRGYFGIRRRSGAWLMKTLAARCALENDPTSAAIEIGKTVTFKR
jgi:hypothetical protein